MMTTIFQLVVLLYSVVLHELAHGLAARSMGDKTAEYAGRLTLNPFKHLDLFGSILMPLVLFLISSPFLFGYAKPVPYNPANLSDRKYGPLKVAIAGPMTNILLAILAGFIIRFGGSVISIQSQLLIAYIVWINLILALFNLMPIPPLDGHWILMTFLPARYAHIRVLLYQYQWLFLAIGIFYIFPLFFPLLSGAFQLLTGTSIR